MCIRDRCVCDTCSSRPYHSGRKYKESLALIFIHHRCLHFRLQRGGGCLVVVELASLVVSCGGHRPPTNATNQRFDWKDHTHTCTELSSLSMSALFGADGAAREHEMGVSSRPGVSCLIMVCSNHGTKLCGMLITYYADHV